MRTLLVSALLALAALAAVPSASAASVPAAQPLPLCVPPGVESFGVCAGTINGNPCAWVWLGASFNAVCVDRASADLLLCDNGGCQSVRGIVGSLIAQPDPVCVPPGVESFGVCAGLVDGDVCAWIWLGPSLRIVCLGDVTASTSTSAAALPVGCATDAVGVCLQREADGTGACVLVHFGLQGAGACADTDPLGVRVCSTVRSVFWDGNCPTDGLLTTTLA